MNPKTLRHTVIGLLMFTGVFHLAVAMVGAAAGYTAITALFGLIYSGLGFWVRRDVTAIGDKTGRTSIIVTLLITASVVAIGGAQFLTNGGPGVLVFMFLIDIAIIAAAALWLTRAHKA